MKKYIFILYTTLTISVIGLPVIQQGSLPCLKVKKQPLTVPYVDIQSYLGTWYEQASIPAYFLIGCTKTKAVYSLQKDKTIRVANSCFRNGKQTQSIGKATPLDSSNSKFKLQFSQSLENNGQYWIVRLADDYSFSVVSNPDYRYLWILYRQKVMPETLYNQIYDDLKEDGFPVEKLVRTQH